MESVSTKDDQQLESKFFSDAREERFRCIPGQFLCNHLEAQVLSVVGYMQSAIDPFFARVAETPVLLRLR